MRILFVAMHYSIHTCRWIDQVSGQGWDVHLFPSWGSGDTHPDLHDVTVHELLYKRRTGLSPSVRLKGLYWPFPERSLATARMGIESMPGAFPWARRVTRLARLIRKLKPDLVESKEIQHAGYLTLEAKGLLKSEFPPWIVNNWGSDIYLFGRLADHVDRIKEVLAECDYYSCECQRDVKLARQFGLKGEVLPVLPNTGGFDLPRVARFRQPGPTSARRLILLKGYQHWAGRALVGLQALSLCADALRGYRVGIHSASDEVRIAAELVSNSTGIPIEIIPRCSRDDMLRLYGQARISIGLSISDGISTSLLEAMVMGAFPIQSCTACADEWIVDMESGAIVPPEDPAPVAAAIRRAVSDDNLVDRAADLNAKVARERLDQARIRPQVIAMYQRIVAEDALRKKGAQPKG